MKISELRVGIPLNTEREAYCSSPSRVEAVGYDWIVVRTINDHILLLEDYPTRPKEFKLWTDEEED